MLVMIFSSLIILLILMAGKSMLQPPKVGKLGVKTLKVTTSMTTYISLLQRNFDPGKSYMEATGRPVY